MALSIDFLDFPFEYPYDDSAIPAARAIIVLGSFREEFLASLAVWNQNQYRTQWKQALVELLEGAPRVALITEYFGGPDRASHLVWWPVYRDAHKVYVHNNLLFYDQLSQPFDVAHATAFISPRITEDEDRNTISEWPLQIDAIQSFVATLP